MANFIETEPLKQPGEVGEQLVWEVIKKAFHGQECLAYWRYPIFVKQGLSSRKEPDILIADRHLGLVVIEVKSVSIQQIVAINGHQWQMQQFHHAYIQPYQQAERQLFAISGYCDNDPLIRRQIAGRVVISLPYITREEWECRGFDSLPCCPPLLLKDDLRPTELYEKLETLSPVIPGASLNTTQWEALQVTLGGVSVLQKNSPGEHPAPVTRREVIDTMREKLMIFDLQQERIGKQIPPGIQRIRGIAGSGKTVLLCQRAAHIHLKHPDWRIALIFFTRSLYHSMTDMVDRWLRHFTNGELSYNPATSPIKIYHAWGAHEQPGFYRTICEAHHIRPLILNDLKSQNMSPSDNLIYICRELLLQRSHITPMFDAILIDEGQDLVTDNETLLFQQKQAFYWLAYQTLKTIDGDTHQRRLYWAYDEAQSLNTLAIPRYKALFGETLSRALTQGVSYKGGINKSEIMTRCYRTPSPILTAAHALGMGLLRPDGMLSGLTTKQEWEQLGYQVKQGEFYPGRRITLFRPPANSPNPVPQLWRRDAVLQFNAYASRAEEIEALAQAIHTHLHDEQLTMREILVIVLGSQYTTKTLVKFFSTQLRQRGIDFFIPSAIRVNDSDPRSPDYDPNRFWHDGGITISNIYRAKGNEAEMVYVVAADEVAQHEEDITFRNQLFVALTRSTGWVKLSGVGNFPMFEEIRRVIAAGNTFDFVFRQPKRRIDDEQGELFAL